MSPVMYFCPLSVFMSPVPYLCLPVPYLCLPPILMSLVPYLCLRWRLCASSPIFVFPVPYLCLLSNIYVPCPVFMFPVSYSCHFMSPVKYLCLLSHICVSCAIFMFPVPYLCLWPAFMSSVPYLCLLWNLFVQGHECEFCNLVSPKWVGTLISQVVLKRCRPKGSEIQFFQTFFLCLSSWGIWGGYVRKGRFCLFSSVFWNLALVRNADLDFVVLLGAWCSFHPSLPLLPPFHSLVHPNIGSFPAPPALIRWPEPQWFQLLIFHRFVQSKPYECDALLHTAIVSFPQVARAPASRAPRLSITVPLHRWCYPPSNGFPDFSCFP